MAVFRPRERLVYFRISEDEFRQFVSVCEKAGARSVSDLARNAVQKLIDESRRQEEEHDVDEKIRLLDRLIAAVTEQLQVLAKGQVAGESCGSGQDREHPNLYDLTTLVGKKTGE